MPDPSVNLHPYAGLGVEYQLANWNPVIPDPAFDDGEFRGAAFGIMQIPSPAPAVGTFARPFFFIVGTSAEIQYCIEGVYQFQRVAADNFTGRFNDAVFIPTDHGGGYVGRFVIVGDDGEVQTVDSAPSPVATQRRTGVAGQHLQNVKYLDGKLFAVGYGATILISTDEGITWSDVAGLPTGFLFSISGGVGSAGSRLITTGLVTAGPTPLLLYSADSGATWIPGTIDPVASSKGLTGLYGSGFYKGKFLITELATILPGDEYTIYIEASKDGQTFTRIPVDEVFSRGGVNNIYQFEIFKGVLVANGLTRIIISSDGESYKGIGNSLFSIQPGERTYGEQALAVGEQGCIIAGRIGSDTPAAWGSQISLT